VCVCVCVCVCGDSSSFGCVVMDDFGACEGVVW